MPRSEKRTKRESPRRAAKQRNAPALVIHRNARPDSTSPLHTADTRNALAHRNASSRQSATKRRESTARRRNAAPRQQDTQDTNPTLRQRIAKMGISHLATKTGAEILGNALAIVVVGKGWLGPKTTAGILTGTGVATAAAGYAANADHVLMAGSGLAHVGVLSLSNTIAVETFQAHEKRQQEKRLKTAEGGNPDATRNEGRNARRLVILDEDGNILEEAEYVAR